MIKIFYGPTIEFENTISKVVDKTNLTKLLSDLEEKKRKVIISSENNSLDTDEKISIRNLVISTEEYSRLSESGINGFLTLLNEVNIDNMYFQNPPEIILEQLNKNYKNKIEEIRYKYKNIEEQHVKKFYDEFSKKIFGQDKCKLKLINNLYKISQGYNKGKPLVILLYGPSGVGKTETAKFLSDILDEKLLRKQFSMYQNNYFSDYVFGSNHSSLSLARDLLDRESNIILFDEFDKSNTIFHSAFYQMFDEGIFVDKNYRVDLKDSIILCTSNFLNLSDIKKSLGTPMFSRFDSFIEYKELSEEISKKIIEMKFDNLYQDLTEEDKKIIHKKEDLPKLIQKSKYLKNAREIDRVINEFIFSRIVNNKFK